MTEQDNKGGCVGCFALLALVVTIAVFLIVNMAPPMVRNVLEAYRLRLLNWVGMQEGSNAADPQHLGFAGSQLSEAQQSAYLQLYAQAADKAASFVVFETDSDDIDPAYKALMRDHPELFWLDGSCTYLYSRMGDVVTVEPGLSVPLDQVPQLEERLEAVVDEFLASLPSDADEYQVIQAAYEYVIRTTDYVPGADQSQNIQSVLLNHESVCAGYARTYEYLLHRAGLFCAFVEGAIANTSEDHAWNLVRVGDVYAHVDATWGDPTYQDADERIASQDVIYDYLGLTTEEITRDGHLISNKDELPECTSHDLDYYVRNGLCFEEYDTAALAESFASQVSDGQNMAMFKFTNEQAYAEAADALAGGTFLTDELLGIAADRGDTRLSYSYVLSDSLRIVKVYW
ncbi:MAG: hypothetical protein Q4A01_07365 [Coriobacteriales bacterium]|nr:hypothetical protein [Coriobacteriales bacterium]